ncbi:multiple epidermal growth factor-like domains protein 10 [Magallana gigas]|uniref:multiple epidermal growth factor-like domains protein 10 n=1 Tax=Magallana gigas TaxID=29159 RepID=UPI00333E8841
MSLSGQSVYLLDVLTVWFCLLAVSQAYVNVALNKPAYHLYPAPGVDRFDASNAVDGRKSDLSGPGGQCAVSYTAKNATWWVNLTSIYSIHHINIYFGTDNDLRNFRFVLTKFILGFSVYVSNTTDRLQGTLCYKDDNSTVETMPTVFTTTCPVHGQYVIYYNERRSGVTYPDGYYYFVSIALCEVEVYGCPSGFYGTNCSNACPDTNCYCHIETGTCQGCKPGFQGYLCTLACDSGWYGLGCSESCGQCRDVNKCINTNGTCLTGCSAGYTGHRCHTSCQYGFFGPDCADRCNDTCDGCNRFNGSCDSGCNPGWNGSECQYACDKGSFGENCSETCGHCRDVDLCSNTNGTCLTGCDVGYQGDLCKTKCDKGSFGIDCNETCGHCREVNLCSHTNGACLTGCSAGFRGNLCKTPCMRGFYGENCTSECVDTCNGCNNVIGLCEYGCYPGWTGAFCQIDCPYGLFGKDCTGECNDNCTGCNNVNGLCDRGCRPGWKGDYCDIGRLPYRKSASVADNCNKITYS